MIIDNYRCIRFEVRLGKLARPGKQIAFLSEHGPKHRPNTSSFNVLVDSSMQVLADAGRSLLTERHLPELPDSPATDDRPDGADCSGAVKVS